MSMGYQTMTMAQACGEAPPSPLAFVVGYDFDPADADEREAVKLATERDHFDRLAAWEADLRQREEDLARRERGEDADPDDGRYDDDGSYLDLDDSEW